MKSVNTSRKNKLISIISLMLACVMIFAVLSLTSCKKKNNGDDVNVDTNGDGYPDVNIDTDGDGNPDINVDTDGDGEPDVNIDTDGDNVADDKIDGDGDNVPDFGSDGIELPIIPLD